MNIVMESTTKAEHLPDFADSRGYLVLARKKGESIVVSDDVVITVISLRNGQVRLGIKTRGRINVRRAEVPERNVYTLDVIDEHDGRDWFAVIRKDGEQVWCSSPKKTGGDAKRVGELMLADFKRWAREERHDAK